MCLGNIIIFAMRSNMALALVAMTDIKSTDPNIPVFDWDTGIQSLILDSVLWGCALSQIPISYLLHGRNGIKFLSFCIFICGVLNLLTPVIAIHIGWIAVVCTRTVIGLCQDSLAHVKAEVISKWAPPGERVFLGNFMTNASEIGHLFAMLMSGILASTRFGWSSIFYITGLVSIIWSILYYCFGAESPAKHKRISPEERMYIEDNGNQPLDTVDTIENKIPWKAILTSVPVWASIFSNCIYFGNYYMFSGMMPSYLKNGLKYNIAESGMFMSLPYVISWLAALPLSWLSDYGLRKGIAITTVRNCASIIGEWGSAICFLILPIVKPTNPVVPIVILVLMMGLFTALNCSYVIIPNDMSPRFSGTLTALITTPGKICAFISPIVYSAIVTDPENVNQWYTAFYVTAFTFILSNITFLIFGSAKVQPWNDPVYLTKKET